MIKPELSNFITLAQNAGIVPISREIVADLDTPLTAFVKVAGDKKHAFLLESLQGGEKWGRYSFIGYNPITTFTSKGESIQIIHGDKTTDTTGDPIEALKVLIESFNACNTDYLPRFFGGAVGYMGYDMVRFMENL